MMLALKNELDQAALDTMTNLIAAEASMLAIPQVECPVIHRFSPGLYIREVHIQGGTLAIGHHQKTAHLNIFLQGRVSMINENGSISELVAPMIFTANPGRKVGWIHEDMVWLNVYATTETDVEKLETMFIEKSMAWEERERISKQAAALQRAEDRKDYIATLSEFGISHEQALIQSQNEADQIPVGGFKCKVGQSAIEGRGLIATALIHAGEVIMPARINGKRTQAGRYTNHAKDPNAVMLMNNGDIDLVALRDIKGCNGGEDGEEITIDYRAALRLREAA